MMRLLFLACVLCACSCSVPEREFMTGLNEAWDEIRPWAEKGIDTDDTVDPIITAKRKEFVAQFEQSLRLGLEVSQ